MTVTSTVDRYGVTEQRTLTDPLDAHVEDIQTKGFTVIDSGVDEPNLKAWRDALDSLLEQQTISGGGRAALAEIGEADMVRAPLCFDGTFLEIAMNTRVMEIVRRLLGNYFILSQQNAVVNRPSDRMHHQGAFHRDLPYQHFTSTRPIAINALFCLDEFTPDIGSTVVLPGSHLKPAFPSDDYVRRNEIATTAAAGGILVMDSMVYHRTGLNRTQRVRRGVNHLYTIPIIKQQISLPALLGGKWSEDALLAQFLGYESEPAASVTAYLEKRRRAKRLKS